MSSAALLTIAGMAAVTYGSRASGLWLGNRLTVTPRVAAVLEALPGCILISFVAHGVMEAGLRGVVAGAAAAVVAMRLRGNIVVPMIAAVAVVSALRLI